MLAKLRLVLLSECNLTLSTLGKCDPRADKLPFFRGKVIQQKYLLLTMVEVAIKLGSMATQ